MAQAFLSGVWQQGLFPLPGKVHDSRGGSHCRVGVMTAGVFPLSGMGVTAGAVPTVKRERETSLYGLICSFKKDASQTGLFAISKFSGEASGTLFGWS